MTLWARRRLLAWYRQAGRDLPWRRTRDPYRILLSEVMLQQTRVTTVLPYYERFLARYPDVERLAVAPEQEVLTLWSGLGYYTRARNLQRAARAIAAAGGFPQSYDAIRALPGVGDYTAAAVGSICFDIPRVVVDGNVLRVMSRYLAERGDVQSAVVRSRIRDEAQALVALRSPGEFNQALMELGATVCLPKQPLCLLCPWNGACEAKRLGIERELPMKKGRTKPVQIEMTVLVIRRRDRILLWQRDAGESRMAGFWELPEPGQVPGARIGQVLGSFFHSITNHHFTVEVREAALSKAVGLHWKRFGDLDHLPLSTIARKSLRRVGKKTVGTE